MRTIREQAADRYVEHPTASTYYFFLDQRRAPFDDPLVREAVNWAIDRAALAAPLRGPDETRLHPARPRRARLRRAPRYGRLPVRRPKRPARHRRARALIRQAGAEGARVTVGGSRAADSRPATEAYARTLNAIGLDARTRLVDPGS